MAAVDTAAAQPGVAVVSMSWGFAEGQDVFAADEAAYDSHFQVPGVTFIASTGDYGAADPQYPAYSPYVVSVGGTSLALNASSSYQSETGWGYQSSAAGAFVGSGGGISLYEPEPGYQSGVQSTGSRTTPDVSLIADPDTGAWIADPFNLAPTNPFEVVGGTSLSAPAWAGLIALANQARVAAGESTLDTAGPTETLQALYHLPQNDYHVITTGNNGYAANAGYNLVTGLGTPIATSLVSDLTAYHGQSTVYSGATVAPLQSAVLTTTGGTTGTIDVMNVFDSFVVGSAAVGNTSAPTGSTSLAVPSSEAPRTATVTPPAATVTVLSTASRVSSWLSPTATFTAPAPSTMAIGPQAGAISVAPVALATPSLPFSFARSSTSVNPGIASSRTPNQPFRVSSAPSRLVPTNAVAREHASARFARVEEPRRREPLAPADEAPSVPSDFTAPWDDAIDAYLAETAETPSIAAASMPGTEPSESQSVSALDSLLAAGAAVALWGCWEFRARGDDGRVRRGSAMPSGRKPA
jgi:hypothetical protein